MKLASFTTQESIAKSCYVNMNVLFILNLLVLGGNHSFVFKSIFKLSFIAKAVAIMYFNTKNGNR